MILETMPRPVFGVLGYDGRLVGMVYEADEGDVIADHYPVVYGGVTWWTYHRTREEAIAYVRRVASEAIYD